MIKNKIVLFMTIVFLNLSCSNNMDSVNSIKTEHNKKQDINTYINNEKNHQKILDTLSIVELPVSFEPEELKKIIPDIDSIYFQKDLTKLEITNFWKTNNYIFVSLRYSYQKTTYLLIGAIESNGKFNVLDFLKEKEFKDGVLIKLYCEVSKTKEYFEICFYDTSMIILSKPRPDDAINSKYIYYDNKSSHVIITNKCP